MKFLLFLFISCVSSFSGPLLYEALTNEWTFAYGIASDVLVNYTETTTDSLNQTITTDRNIDFANLDKFLFPVIQYPMTIVYNLPLLNGTLKLTRGLVQRMLTNDTMRWNDPDLLMYNPSLSTVGTYVRLFIDSGSSPTNQMLIDYFFDNATNQNGSWRGLAVPKHLVKDYTSVIAAIGLSFNTMAFLHGPYVTTLNNQNVKFAHIIDGVNELSPLVVPNVKMVSYGNVMRADVQDPNSSWPFIMFAYSGFDSYTESCDESLVLMRFLYWSLGNPHLDDQTTQKGFNLFDHTSYEILKQHMKSAKCNDKVLLAYNNLSTGTRSNAVFGISLVLMTFFLVLVGSGYILRSDKKKPIVIINHLVVVIGLVLSLISFVIWWFSPSQTWICQSRFWLIGFGYTNVIASIYIYAFSMNALLSQKGISRMMLTTRNLVVAYIVLEVLELFLLILWQVIEEPRSSEVVVDPINWQSTYVCQTNGNNLELVQLVYFCLISLFGAYVILKFWKKSSPENTRWLLVALYDQLFAFLPLMIFIKTQNFEDSELYNLTVPVYLFAIANVICAFFGVKLINKIKSLVQTSNKTEMTENPVLTREKSELVELP